MPHVKRRYKNLKTPVSFRLSEDELTLLDRAAEQFDPNKTKAVVEGLRLLVEGKKLSKAALMAEIGRRLK